MSVYHLVIEDQSRVEQLRQFAWKRLPAVENMALDAAMLEAGQLDGSAFWRVYGWSEPAMTFGYSQRWMDIERASPGFTGQRIRRMTGGGIVDHRADLTYALSLPPSHPFYRVQALEIYRELHLRIVEVLRAWGITCTLAPCPGRCTDGPGRIQTACFTAPEPYDILDPRTGCKLAGAAMKRNRMGLLIQGSIDASRIPTPDPERFDRDMGKGLATWLDWRVTPASTLPEKLLEQQRKRFASVDWNRRR